MKGNKTKIASMILAASVAFMASACTVKFTDGDRTNTTEQASEEASEATAETKSTTEVSVSTEEEQTKTKDIPAPYVEVLDYLYDGLQSEEIKNTDFDELKYNMGPGISETAFYSEDPMNKLWYVLLDLDDNGTDELLIVKTYEYEDNGSFDEIQELYTITDGQLDHVFSGWGRSRYFLKADKSLFYDGNGGYAYISWEYVRLDGNQLVVTDSYYSTNEINGEMQDEVYVFHKTGTGEDELVGIRDDDTIPTIGETYVYSDKTYIADYK
ncbi:MAG: hypothetical protein J6U23_04235 [Clostridiales bacterium]|nr:hypothetical protein [Clostridiales bacterium]